VYNNKLKKMEASITAKNPDVRQTAYELGRLHGFYDAGDAGDFLSSDLVLRDSLHGSLSAGAQAIRQYVAGYRDGSACRRLIRSAGIRRDIKEPDSKP